MMDADGKRENEKSYGHHTQNHQKFMEDHKNFMMNSRQAIFFKDMLALFFFLNFRGFFFGP